MNAAATTQRFFLKKEDRLKSRKAIELLFAKGKSFSEFPFRVLWMISENAAGLKAGFSVSSKSFKRAVDRNRIKRLMREAYRLQKNELQNDPALTQKSLGIFFIYTGKVLPEHTIIFEKTGTVLKKFLKIIHENA